MSEQELDEFMCLLGAEAAQEDTERLSSEEDE